MNEEICTVVEITGSSLPQVITVIRRASRETWSVYQPDLDAFLASLGIEPPNYELV